jgi:hypothetical protein
MSKEIPAGIRIEKSFQFNRLFRLKGTSGPGLVWIGAAGLLAVVFLVYLTVVAGNVNKPAIRFNPADVVYGEQVHASHEMLLDNVSDPSNNLPVKASARPAIQLSEQFYDFGAVGTDQVLKHTFVIANLGQVPLVIFHAYTTCGCTAADFTSANIPPGKVALMTLQFDPGYHNMHSTTVRRGVMIETNDPAHPLQEIWIQASVK